MPVSMKTLLLSLAFIAFLAGLTFAQSQLVGDLDGNYRVDFKDLRMFSLQWLDPDCLAPGCIGDLDGLNGVNMADFALLVQNWQVEAPHLVISEFMASNASSLPLDDSELLDGNGESSDWIEIYNPSGIDVNLTGWYLTDNKNNLTKWQFPDGLEIKAGEFLIIFASDKTYEEYPLNYPYLDPGGDYHTNFELDKDSGEYLALVAPDSNVVVHEYAPQFPIQLTDISYGLTQYGVTLVSAGATTSYHVPTSGDAGLGTGWTAVDFNDSEWDTGQTGIGFGLGGERMVAYNDCVYSSGDLYIANNVTTYGIGSGYSGSTSGPLVDQVTGDDMGVTVALTESGGVNWQPDPDNGGSDCAVGTDAHNTFSGISDMTGVIFYGNTGWWIDLTFTGLNPTTEYTFATSANRGNSNYTNRLTIYTLTGADTYTNASTSGVDVLAENKVRFITGDNFSNGYVARWTGITAADGSFTVRAEADPNSGDGRRAYSFDVFMLEGGSRGTDVQNDMLGVNASLWMRTEFNLEEGESEIFDTLTLRMKYEDGFAAYLNGQPVTSRNAPNSVPWDSTALSDRPDANSSAAEVINIMSSVYALQDGRNVLAIHGLNDNAADPNFLILPELTAASNMTVPQYFTTPTPKKFNVPGAKGIADEVWFSHKRGFYDTGFQLILSTGDDDAVIRYTRDGSQPTVTHGFTYSSPINVSGTTSIRAVAVKPGYLDSEVEAHTYIFVDDVVLQNYQATLDAGFPSSWGGTSPDYGMDPDVIGQFGVDLFGGIYTATIRNDLKSIPTLSILMDVNDMFGSNGIYTNSTSRGLYWERPGSAELIYPDSREGFQVNCGVRIQGGWFRQHSGTKKHSLRLLFKSIYGETKLRYPWFGEDAVDYFDTIVLRAGANDGYSWDAAYLTEQYTRDEFGRGLQRATGNAGSHGTFVHLYINGIYWGLYNPVERPDEAFSASYYGGRKEDWDSLHDGSVHNGDKNAWNQMLTLCVLAQSSNAAYQQLQGKNLDGTPNPNYPHLMDVPNYIDYLIVNLWGGNWDWPWKNWWAGRHRSADSTGYKFYCWDYENTMGNNRSRSPLNKNALNNNFSSAGEPHQSLKLNAEYRMLFADRVHQFFFNGAILTPESLDPRYGELAARVERSIVAESARWGDQHHNPPLTLQEWYNERGWILNTYLPDRTDIVLQDFIDAGLYPSVSAPVFSINGSYQHGGEVSAGDQLTMNTPPSGTIYYTIDGSDPRQPITGTPVGTSYAPITLNKSTHVKARVLDVSTWSALNEATFAIGQVAENLRITEIMYHPKSTGDPNDPNTEFIELKNVGTSTLNINLVKFTEGIHFTFPDTELDPNECIVVTRDQSAFEAKYGTSVNTAGSYIGSLANNGERIKLEDAAGRTILDFEYEDGWRSITDGDGFSLTMIDPGNSSIFGSDEGLVAHWKFDEGSGGTATDSAGTNNGALTGPPTWTTGRIDGALSFDGAGDYVVAAPVAPLAGDTFTVQAWIRIDSSAVIMNPFLMQNRSSDNFGFYIYIYNDRPDVYFFGSYYAQASSTETLNADQWYHIAATNNGSKLKLYVDGQFIDSDSSTGLTGVNENFYIGCKLPSLYFTGLVDDVRIYNREISDSEFQDMAEPMRRWSQKSSWRASLYRNGTPGADDIDRLPNPGAVVINEVMAHSNAGPDWIELYNTTGAPIDIGGWFLSDNNRDEPNLTKYRIADGTTINPNNYLVFYQDANFSNPGDPGCNVPFALSENGEDASLSSYLDPNGYLTGYRQVEDFGASQTNVSLGRYYKSSTGNFNFVAMDSNTPDANNAYPKVGPVVINEIMYNPPSGNQNEEYIELHNITGEMVTLYRHDKSTPWKFTDGIDYTFPPIPFATIQAGGYLILARDLTAFTAKYGSVPSDVQLLGGYSGRLSNAGERLQIGMPGDIDGQGARQYIRIDRVTYSDGWHPEDCPGGVDLWPPEADGLGKSLSRIDPNDYGNDVINWEAATPSPGLANP